MFVQMSKDKQWVVDSGATCHICNKQELPGAEELSAEEAEGVTGNND